MSTHRPQEEEFHSRLSWPSVKKILSVLKEYRAGAIGFIVLIAFVAVQDGVFTMISRAIIDRAITPGNTVLLIRLIMIYLGMAIFQAILVFSFINLAGVLGEKVQYSLRKKLFSHLQSLSFSYFDRTPVGWIMSRVTSDSQRVSELVTWGLIDVTWSIVNICTSLGFMFWINWKLTLLILTILPVMITTAVYFQSKIIRQYRITRRMNSKITGEYNENITGVRVVKALNREKRNLQEFSVHTGKMYQAAFKAAWLSALFLPAIQMAGSVALGTIIWYGGIRSIQGEISLGDIYAFILYIWFMLWPIQQMARVWASMQKSLASSERIFSLLDKKPAVKNRPGAKDPGHIRTDIEFRDVIFEYEPGKTVLQGFNLKIHQGETLALVGATGGGKSTIFNLLCRFYEPVHGSIIIHGMDYRDLTLRSIQSRIGVVLQTSHLFSGTVLDNIRYGRLDADLDAVRKAAKIARADEFIIHLDKGYETEVGEDGGLLSVGQKQLISLARAVLSDPDVFIMDEATSSIDTVTEKLIQEGLAGITKERTSLIIAHRLSTVRHADRILVIDGGRIVEQGRHEDLIRLKGRYYSLHSTQFRERT